MAADFPPQVPENLKVPETEVVALKALGKGKQIYGCKAKADNPLQFEWALLRPQADLFDGRGEKIGSHFEGPTWEEPDGSKVVGAVQQRANAPKGNAVPWLLLKAKSNQGNGLFGHVTYIQRVDTVGGAAPSSGCDKSSVGNEIQVDYQADYYFYVHKPQGQ